VFYRFEQTGRSGARETGSSVRTGVIMSVDGVIPFADSLSSSGAYDPAMPGIGFSQTSGEVVGAVSGIIYGGVLRSLRPTANWLARMPVGE